MRQKGIATLADIARELDTTPQAVSNWKSEISTLSIVALVNKSNLYQQNDKSDLMIQNYKYQNSYNEISLSNILVTFAEQLKVIAFCFCFSFISFTIGLKMRYFLNQNQKFTSIGIWHFRWNGWLSFLFGVSLGQDSSPADLSSPVLFPEIIKTHSFTEKILGDTFRISSSNQKQTLFEILLSKKGKNLNSQEIKEDIKNEFSSMVSLVKAGKYYELTVRVFDPL